jgi:hypothetical protein
LLVQREDFIAWLQVFNVDQATIGQTQNKLAALSRLPPSNHHYETALASKYFGLTGVWMDN